MAVHYPADYEVFSLVCIDDVASKPKDPKIIQYVNDKLGEKYISQFGEFIATAEDDLTLYAMRDLEQLLGKSITWVRGISFDELIKEGHDSVLAGNKRRLPSWARRYCTERMKLLPIFLWWFDNIGEKCKMRIGFRQDEFERMLRFFNNSDPVNFSIPISCNTYGQKRQAFQTFNWRFCDMPLIKDEVKTEKIEKFWNNTYVGGSLFEEYRKIQFPVISNCVGCFHKNEEIIAAMAEINPFKIGWFAKQENKGMGTWLDSRVTYQHLIDNRIEIAAERIYEIQKLGQTCDSGGCTA